MHVHIEEHVLPRSRNPSAPSSLSRVRNIIAVASCKGGVGKSTVAVNLAFALSRLGSFGRVGLLDADVYGPSLPSLVPVPPSTLPLLRQANKLLLPPEVDGVRLMSYGFVGVGSVSGDYKAALLRGPRVSSIVGQMASGTDWGPLDYLVVDLPPGTGDVQLSLCERLSFTSAVVVTTPQELSYVDVVRGIDMFKSLDVPICSLVENMSWFDGDDGKRYLPFGAGRVDFLKKYVSSDDPIGTFSLPIESRLSPSNGVDKRVKEIFENDTSSSTSLQAPVIASSEMGFVKEEFERLANCVAEFCVDIPEKETGEMKEKNILSKNKTVFDALPSRREELTFSGVDGSGGVTRVHFDVRRGLVLRFLSGTRQGQEYVVPMKHFRKGTTDDSVPIAIVGNGFDGIEVQWSEDQRECLTYEQMIDSVCKDKLK
eukprot:g1296.t1